MGGWVEERERERERERELSVCVRFKRGFSVKLPCNLAMNRARSPSDVQTHLDALYNLQDRES